jgi:hypothetical protein
MKTELRSKHGIEIRIVKFGVQVAFGAKKRAKALLLKVRVAKV